MGIRVEPPTSTTWWMSVRLFWVLAFQSVTALSKGTRSRSTRSEVIRSSSPRVRRCSMWSGPSGVAVMKGRLIVVSRVEESSILAFSAASLSRCMAILSLDRSMPWLFLKVVSSHSTIRWSQSSPPRCMSPEVD